MKEIQNTAFHLYSSREKLTTHVEKNKVENVSKNNPYVLQIFINIMIGSTSLGMAFPYLEIFSNSLGAAGKVFSIIDNVPTIDSSSDEGLKPQAVMGDIEFRNVGFTYPTRPDTQVS